MKVGVIFGGNSVEHDVSIISAVQVMNQLKNHYDVVPIYIDKNNDLFTSRNFPEIKSIEKKLCFKKVRFVKGGIRHIFKTKLDFVFTLTHGKNLEDGNVKAILDFYKIPNNSNDLIPSAICQDKVILKDILKTNGINVVDYIWFYDYEWYNDYQNVINRIPFDYPVIIKPATLGSSIGIKVCTSDEELFEATVDALKYDNKILIEKYINNKEYTISLIGYKHDVTRSEIEEVNEGFYTFEKKYKNKSSLTDTINKKEIAELAISCFKILGLKGIVRIDILEDESNVYISEVNTVPGSLSKYLWDLSNKEFYEKLIYIGYTEDNILNSFESGLLQKQEYKISEFI